MSETTTSIDGTQPDADSQTVSDMPSRTDSIEGLALIVVTYKRQELLAKLIDSICALNRAPWRIIVVDNEHSEQTRAMVADLAARACARWGTDVEHPDEAGGTDRVVYAPQRDNLGGAGGFSAGIGLAWELGARWFWVMDDDVSVMPDAIELLAPWTREHLVIQGSRLDYDGSPFYWQYRFINSLGIPNPIAPAAFGPEGYRPMNTLCFEGGLFARCIVDRIGLPDPRFFIYFDDAIYGYLASKVTDPIVCADLILQRTRDIAHWNIANVRQLNGTSDMNRYHIMRNRGYMARYFREHGDYNRLLFGVGTAATFAKEIIRLVAVDRTFKSGLTALLKGMRDARRIYRDRTWEAMPPLATPAADEQPGEQQRTGIRS
ncbi:glycosyl transferase family 2 [Coriobacterium glomerans PW2]|uniref:Glycosyl transferase family 2 n=1 Tax=Coriobacterium glomerans (strain ATCC 49209 / DSM 20642 / JCM 10262 / PW2) TaxID=700015 RepID=F2N7L5_CORGP|nr:glycosyltransferase [Coriobacterium glomerans]AEB06831.1 glycosyl transferase family 2 [Coriobacterium glomerans PW2]